MYRNNPEPPQAKDADTDATEYENAFIILIVGSQIKSTTQV